VHEVRNQGAFAVLAAVGGGGEFNGVEDHFMNQFCERSQ
jgi:hypothetical protein